MIVISVVLPVLNEAEALPWVLGRMPSRYHPLVVDNGSVDGSAQIALSLGAEVVEESRRGFGAACAAGLVAVRTELVCFMDCDGSLDPRCLDRVVAPVADGSANLVLGRRRPQRGAWPLHARLANVVVARAMKRKGLDLKDLGPMRACRTEDLVDLDIRDRRSGWPLEMVLRAHAQGWRVREVPVPYLKRAGRSKVTGTIRGSVTAARDMSRLLA